MMEFSILLHCAPGPAFDLFTRRASEWWPPSHRQSGDPSSRIVIAKDGTFREHASDGRIFPMGRVREWDEPRRILMDFFMGTGPTQPTEVEILFTSAEGGTRITVLHRSGSADTRLFETTAPKFRAAWPTVLSSIANHDAHSTGMQERRDAVDAP